MMFTPVPSWLHTMLLITLTNLMRCAPQIGIKFWLQHLPESVSQAAVESAVSQICQDASMDGILVQVHP